MALVAVIVVILTRFQHHCTSNGKVLHGEDHLEKIVDPSHSPNEHIGNNRNLARIFYQVTPVSHLLKHPISTFFSGRTGI
jgi:hypothetical protein